MLRTVLTYFVVLLIAVGGGAASVWYALAASAGLGALRVGVWTAFPLAGTPSADPYTKARIAREAELPLGAAEGLVFVASRDETGAALRQECDYRIEGTVPIARFWTLVAADANQRPLPPAGTRPAAIGSLDVLRQPDNSLVVTASRTIQPGNWLALTGSGSLSLVLSLYDTPIASTDGVGGVDLPQVLRVSCNG